MAPSQRVPDTLELKEGDLWEVWASVGRHLLTCLGASSRRGCLLFGGPYAWANFTILALGVWAVAQRDSIDAISMVSPEAARGLASWLWPCPVLPSPAPVFCPSPVLPFPIS